MAKLPAFQFYPGDWMKDPALRSVSYAARGLWMDMLSLMFENDRRGYLQVNGKPVNAAQLARMTGGATDEVSHCLQELENSGVYSSTDDGTIFSRRIVRDERQRQQTAVRVHRYRQRNSDVTQAVTPSSEDEEEIAVEVDFGSSLKPKEVLVELSLSSLEELIYADYPRKVGRPKALSAIGKAIHKIRNEFGLEANEAAEYLHKAVIEFARSPAGQKGEYTPHPATWMNQERWNDDRHEWYRESDSERRGPQASPGAQRTARSVNAAAEAIADLDSDGTRGAGEVAKSSARRSGDFQDLRPPPVGPEPITIEGRIRKMP